MAHEPLIALLDAVVAGSGKALLSAINVLSGHTPDYEIAADTLIHLLHQVSVIQLIEPIDQEDDELSRLAHKLSPEDVQLFYQIALYGRRDLPLSPDLRMGFEMIVLRMLAFRPVDMQQVSALSSKKKTLISPEKVRHPLIQTENITNQKNALNKTLTKKSDQKTRIQIAAHDQPPHITANSSPLLNPFLHLLLPRPRKKAH